MLSTMRWMSITAAAFLALAFAVACGDDDDLGSSGTDVSATPDATPDLTTRAPRDPLSAPHEGPDLGPFPEEPIDFREDPDWRHPDPESRPTPAPDDKSDVVFGPPAEPSCPEDWERVERLPEDFSICHPDSWEEDSSYVNHEVRWYAIGFFDFPGGDREHQLAHVSVYVFPEFSLTVRYALDCPEAYSVTFAGEPSVVCPDFPPVAPEARIISYHVFRDQRHYFVNVAAYLEYDEENGEYSDSLNEEAFNQAIEIAHTFQFDPLATRQ